MEISVVLAQESTGNPLGALLGVLFLAALVFGGFKAFQASKQETSELRTVKSLPPSIQHVVSQMDSASQNAFFNEYEKKKKKKSVGWIAWFLIGWHYLYVGKVGIQFAFWFTFGGFFIWWVVDFFRMPSIIRAANEQIARDAIQTLGTAAAFGVGASPQNPPQQTPQAQPPAVDPTSQPPAVEPPRQPPEASGPNSPDLEPPSG